MDNKLKDFGKKIGGARKDLWIKRGLLWSDTEEMTDPEKQKYVKRDYIWPKPETSSVPEECRLLVYWQCEMRKCLYPNPRKTDEDSLRRYVEEIGKFKELTMSVQNEKDIESFMKASIKGQIMKPTGGHYYSAAEEYADAVDDTRYIRLYNSTLHLWQFKRKMEKSGFGVPKNERLLSKYPVFEVEEGPFEIKTSSDSKGFFLLRHIGKATYYYYPSANFLGSVSYGSFILANDTLHRIEFGGTEDDCKVMQAELLKQSSEKTKRKKTFLPPQLKNIRRIGADYRHGKDVAGEKLLKDFGIRGGEFGNWTSNADRIHSLNMAYDAFMDMAEALEIQNTDISLPGLLTGSLGIAFGARGSGNYVATYEPTREVINITRMRGPGSLAHEWGHALDDFIGKKSGGTEMASDLLGTKTNITIPGSMEVLLNELKYSKEKKAYTQYFVSSRKYGSMYSKSGIGYWTSSCELFARAYACYLLDVLAKKGIVDDYLVGHAEVNVDMDAKGNIVRAYPVGEEREYFNTLFDNLFTELKQLGWLAQRTEFKPEPVQNPFSWIDSFKQEEDGQMILAF